MKNKFKRISLLIMLAAVLVFTSSVSATGTTTNVSRVQYFTIQNNNVCTADGHYSTIYLNINNISNSAANVTVYLYNDIGEEVNYPGSTGNALSEYIPSSFTPGTSFVLNGKTTGHYYTSYGSSTGYSCDDRPAYGKIVIESDSGLFMANGEIKGTDVRPTVGHRMLTETPIFINGGNPF